MPSASNVSVLEGLPYPPCGIVFVTSAGGPGGALLVMEDAPGRSAAEAASVPDGMNGRDTEGDGGGIRVVAPECKVRIITEGGGEAVACTASSEVVVSGRLEMSLVEPYPWGVAVPRGLDDAGPGRVKVTTSGAVGSSVGSVKVTTRGDAGEVVSGSSGVRPLDAGPSVTTGGVSEAEPMGWRVGPIGRGLPVCVPAAEGIVVGAE